MVGLSLEREIPLILRLDKTLPSISFMLESLQLSSESATICAQHMVN